MKPQSLQLLNKVAYLKEHLPYIQTLASALVDYEDFGYAIEVNGSYYCLTNFVNHHPLSSPFPYLILPFQSECDGLDAFLKVHLAKQWSVIHKAQFVSLAMAHLNSRSAVKALLPYLGFASQQTIVSSLLKIATLPSLLCEYAIQKKVAFKSLVYISGYKAQFLTWFDADILPYIDPSCSVLLECLDGLYYCFQRLGSTEAVMDALEWNVNKRLSSDQRLKELRLRLVALRYPTQVRVNEALEQYVASLCLDDKKISVDWDTSLENRGFNLAISITSVDDLNLIDSLVDKKESLKNLLEKMSYDSY